MGRNIFAIGMGLLGLSAPGLIAVADEMTACEQIQRACGQAGYTRDLPDGRDLVTRCYQPLLLGQEIRGVAVEPSLVKKCNEQQKNKPSQKKGRRH